MFLFSMIVLASIIGILAFRFGLPLSIGNPLEFLGIVILSGFSLWISAVALEAGATLGFGFYFMAKAMLGAAVSLYILITMITHGGEAKKWNCIGTFER